MFFCMFKGRNEYGLSLIIFSFASFFMLPGLSSVSHAKSVHEKGHMKSMMAQKVSYRVLAMDPLVVAPETGEPQGEPQASEAEAVASQPVELQAVSPEVDGVSGDQSFVAPVDFFQGIESEISGTQVAPQASGFEGFEPEVSNIDEAFGTRFFGFSFLLNLLDIVFPQPVDLGDVNPDHPGLSILSRGTEIGKTQVEPQEPAFKAPLNVDSSSGVIVPQSSEIGGTQVEPQAPALEALPDVDTASGVIVPQSFEIDGTQVGSQAIPLPAIPLQEPTLEAIPPLDVAPQNTTPQVPVIIVLDEAILLNAAGDDYAADYDFTDFYTGVLQ